MKEWKLILIITSCALLVALLGFIIGCASNISYMPKATNDSQFATIKKDKDETKDDKENDRCKFIKVDIKLTNKFTDEEKDKYSDANSKYIKASLKANFGEEDKNLCHEFVMRFDKDTYELINEEEILNNIKSMNIDFWDEYVPQIIEKCKREKLYLYTSLNMSYQSSQISSN